MSRFQNRDQFQYGLESQTNQKLKKVANNLKIHPGYLVMQMTELLTEKPHILFDYLSEKCKKGL